MYKNRFGKFLKPLDINLIEDLLVCLTFFRSRMKVTTKSIIHFMQEITLFVSVGGLPSTKNLNSS